VETMGAAEAALLAAGCSALCLTTRLNRLQLYKPLVRDLNWLGIGPVLAAVNSPTVVEQPRMIYPGRTAIGLPPFPSFLAPYRWATAAADASRVRQGWAAVAGAGVGESYPIGEVSS
jgi:hypothetical protein